MRSFRAQIADRHGMGPIRRRLRELGLFAPPPDLEHRRGLYGVYLLIGSGLVLLGPLIDWIWHLLDSAHPAFQPTSWWNVGISLGFLLNYAVCRAVSLRLAVRLTILFSLAVGVLGMPHFGGAFTPGVIFFGLPILLSAFYLGMVESAVVALATVAAWCGLAIWEISGQPVAPPPTDPELVYLVVGVIGLGSVWINAAGYFSAHRRLHQQLLRQETQLRNALSARDLFLSTVSHELRTPLASIVGNADLLDDESQENKQLRQIRTASRQLLRMIDNILDFNRLEAGALQLTPVACNPSTVVEGVVALFEGLHSEDVTLATDCDGHPREIKMCRELVERILINLLSNAVKATARGRIQVTATWSTDAFSATVLDTGPGIGAEQKNRAPALGEGIGLGLTLCREMVARLNGTFEIGGETGEGTKATFMIPVTEISELATVTEAMDEQATQSPLELLIVDDEPDLRAVFQAYCASFGWSAKTAASVSEALQLAEHRRPDLILMDILMPETDGIEGLRQLRNESATAHIPVIALTAHIGMDRASEFRDVGFDGFIPKPIGLQAFRTAVEAYSKRS